jgi:ABC-type multidrug transport system ATPase subunit
MFAVWVDQKESFYCSLDKCSWDVEHTEKRNTTSYKCDTLQCKCIPGRMLCGENGNVDIGDFLEEEIKGPAKFVTRRTEGGSKEDGSVFDEKAMNTLISQVFGEPSITMNCNPGECLYLTEVPGYSKPVPKINTPLIAGVIAGAALFVVAVVLLVWYLSRRKLDGYGPIHLEDSDDESARLLAEHKSASLQFQNVAYNLNGKQILSGVQGMVQPGQIMAIMGASGAGKTTFLDILARKNKRGVTSGDFFVNGEQVLDQEYRNVIGFVDQEDAMLPTLTVHETITTSAMLRLPKDMSHASKEQKVQEVEKQLGIWHIRDQLIGSEEGKGRGISGGEKRRVGIACELVTSPSILFLDEPTSGLDAFNAFNVIECLVTLAKQYNRTIVFTIHQPRSNIVALFDSLVLLAKGRTVYSGPFSECQAYFDSIGYTCPPGFNIADYLVDLTMHAGEDRAPTEASELNYEDNRTVSSSMRAVKSVASASNVSIDNSTYGSPGNSMRRPPHQRRQSIKQQQDRKLYTRKAGSFSGPSGVRTPESVRTEDEVPAPDLNNTLEASQQWLRLSRHAGGVPGQGLDDSHQPSMSAAGLNSDLEELVNNYSRSNVARSMREEIEASVLHASTSNGDSNGANGATKTGTIKSYARVGLFKQFTILSSRTLKNLYRNPMLMLAHYAIAILVAVLCGFLFYGLSSDIKGFQNRLGLIFFILALLGFSTLTSLVVFSSERLIFLRERANGYYHPLVYFTTKVLFDIVPLRLFPPIIIAIIVYPMTGLIPHWGVFFKFLLTLVLFNLTASIICLFIGIICRDPGLANLVGSLHMLFSLLFAGFLLNREALPKSAAWLQKVRAFRISRMIDEFANTLQLSMFHYGFEALIVNEVNPLRLIDHKYGLDIEVPGASILSSFGFEALMLWNDILGLAIMSAVMLVVSYIALHFLLVERR